MKASDKKLLIITPRGHHRVCAEEPISYMQEIIRSGELSKLRDTVEKDLKFVINEISEEQGNDLYKATRRLLAGDLIFTNIRKSYYEQCLQNKKRVNR